MSSLIARQSYLFTIRRLAEMAGAGTDVMSHEMIAIYLVLHGEVAIAAKGGGVSLTSNDLYCMQVAGHYDTVIKKGTEGYVICFKRALLYTDDEAFNCSYFPAFETLVLRREVIQIGSSFLNEGNKLCEMMLQEFEEESDFKLQILSGFLSIFLIQLVRKSNIFLYKSDTKNKHSLVGKFNILLEQNFKTTKKVADYAALLFVTPGYLNEIMKQATGKSVSSLIHQRIAVEAVRQANQTGATMKEVAGNLGFHDNSHFSKFFKRVCGENFSEIRK